MAKTLEFTSAILRRPDGKLIMQRRDGKAPSNPYKLGLFGGSLHAREEPLVGIKREIEEETSLAVETLKIRFLFSVDIPHQKDRQLITRTHVFSVPVKDEAFKVFEGRGKEEYDLEELQRRDDVDYYVKIILKRYKEDGAKYN